MAMDPSEITAAVEVVGTAVVAVGGAVLLIQAGLHALREIRAAMDSAGGASGGHPDGPLGFDEQAVIDAAFKDGFWHRITVNGVERTVWVERDEDDTDDAEWEARKARAVARY